MIEGLFGRVDETISYRPTMRRYPVVAWRLPRAFLTVPRQINEVVAENEPWWRDSIARLEQLTMPAAQALMADGLRRFDKAERIQTLSVVASISPLFEALSGLVEKAGVGDVATLGGTGGAEMAIVADIWAASRGRLAVETFLTRHGFHGPLEGEIASRVWREDPAPLEKVIASYAAMDDAEDPTLRDRGAAQRLAQMQAEVVAATSRSQRAGAKLIMSLAARRLPQRGYAKRAFLQAIDVIRGATRAIGVQLVEQGRLDQSDDAFFLTKEELARPLPADARQLVARRRERRELFKTLVLPGSWTGELIPEFQSSHRPAADADLLTGVGVSPGIVEGVVAVVHDASFADVHDGAVLVAPTTDPSWSSIMFVSAALVVDIGGHLSHAAVVARELGIPCVVNTRSGTAALRTGDRVRVDGTSGRVEVLERA
jgi:pyruvate,water dikinase